MESGAGISSAWAGRTFIEYVFPSTRRTDRQDRRQLRMTAGFSCKTVTLLQDWCHSRSYRGKPLWEHHHGVEGCRKGMSDHAGLGVELESHRDVVVPCHQLGTENLHRLNGTPNTHPHPRRRHPWLPSLSSILLQTLPEPSNTLTHPCPARLTCRLHPMLQCP